MNKIIKGLCLMALLAACERIVDFPAEEHGRIYVNAIIGHTDQDMIIVNISKPAFGTETTKSEDVSLSLEADGREIALERNVNHEPEFEGEISYLISEKLLPGASLKLTAEAADLPQVEALTSVPEVVENVDITTRLATVYKSKNANESGYIRTLREFKIGVDNEAGKDEFFGVQVRRKIVIDTIGAVPLNQWEICKVDNGVEQYEQLFVNSKVGADINISSVDVEMITIFEGGQMRVMASKRDEGKATVAVYIEPYERHLLRGSYTGGQRDWEIHEDYEYNIKVCRLSPEMYYCMRAGYIKEWSDPSVNLGFSSPSYIYSNVEGGLGMFGAMSLYESGWFKID